MSESATLRLDPNVRDRLAALAAARGMNPAELVAELVLQAETTQVVTEVNVELEKLAGRPVAQRSTEAREREEMRRVDRTVTAWMQR